MTLYEELKWRGLIKDQTNNKDFEEKINSGNITFYWGTDPTADSLHIGHYSSLITAKRLANYGHHPILLIGGATGMIGDPRPTAEREIIPKEKVFSNFESIKKQVTEIFNGNVEVVNNYDWMKDFSFLDFLRDVGKYINVNYMLDKDIIRRRLETGITYAEFSYTLIQGYDFLHLYKEKNCIMQAAGSDQWGNITTGIELISKILGKQAYGFTMPLILDQNGKKFGKSEGNALWLDKNKTSSYDIYQYLINSSDEKVEEYLKVYTFLDKEQIDDIMKKHNEKREDRFAQKTLAYEMIKDLRGKEEADNAKQMSEDIFSGKAKNSNIEKLKLPEDILITDAIVKAGFASSKSQAKTLVMQGGISLDDKKITDINYKISKKELEENVILKKGKKNFIMLEN